MTGSALKAAREARGATINDVAEATRIKIQIIEAIERDDFSLIPAPTYARGFIKLYADFVGLDAEPLLQAYTDRYRPTDPRRGAARQVTAKAAASETTGTSKPGSPRWIDTLPLTRVAARVGLAAGALVMAVLLLTGLFKLVSGAISAAGNRDTTEEQPSTDWTRVAEPPDSVLTLPETDGSTP